MRLAASMFVLLALGGCASAGRVRAISDSGNLRFNFDRGGKAVPVVGISVYEVKDGRRVKRVCDVRPISLWAKDIGSMGAWVYGQNAGSNYALVECAPLKRGHDYGVDVRQPGRCVSFTDFRLADDGAVSDLGPNGAVCGG